MNINNKNEILRSAIQAFILFQIQTELRWFDSKWWKMTISPLDSGYFGGACVEIMNQAFPL